MGCVKLNVRDVVPCDGDDKKFSRAGVVQAPKSFSVPKSRPFESAWRLGTTRGRVGLCIATPNLTLFRSLPFNDYHN